MRLPCGLQLTAPRARVGGAGVVVYAAAMALRAGFAVASAHGDRLLFAGLAPDWHGYFPVPYTEGYEEGLSLGPEAVRMIADALASS